MYATLAHNGLAVLGVHVGLINSINNHPPNDGTLVTYSTPSRSPSTAVHAGSPAEDAAKIKHRLLAAGAGVVRAC